MKLILQSLSASTNWNYEDQAGNFEWCKKIWAREISICIKPWKRELIQILKSSLNLRDCLSHFDWEKLMLQCLYFFLLLLFHPWATPHVPTVDQLKKGCFPPHKNDITVVSLFASCCYFIQEAHHRFRIKRNQLFGTTNNLLTYFEWANADEDVFMCLLKEVSVIVARRMLSKRNISCCQLPQYKKKETNTEQCRQQSSLAVEHKRKHLKNC